MLQVEFMELKQVSVNIAALIVQMQTVTEQIEGQLNLCRAEI